MALGWDLPGVFTDDEELAAEMAKHPKAASFTLRLTTRDKMGNACVVGGADVTSSAAPCELGADDEEAGIETRVTDCGDG